FRIDEAVGNPFLIAARDYQAARCRQFGTGFWLGLGRKARLGITNWQAVVTVQPPQFFNRVDLKADIETMAGHADFPAALRLLDNAQAQRRKQRDDLPCRQLQSEHLIDTLSTQYYRRDFR